VDRLTRHLPWAVPALLSLLLSAFTVGNRVYWQDSGFYLSAVKELGVLYPHGFVLFLLLCKLWTLALFFVPFTLAVHLFSAACAAGAAGALASAAASLLRSRGPIFQVSAEDPGAETAGWVGGAVGCLAAAGFTFWSAAIYAKTYAFLYLVLALLLRALIRADDLRTPRSFGIVAALIGLAWQAHPSSVLLGPALILFLVVHRKTLGARGLLRGLGLAAAIALAPTLLLPVLAARDTDIAFGHPVSLREWLPYITGSGFTSIPGVFGLDETRVLSVVRFFWEETLAASFLVVLGLVRLARVGRRALLGLAVWTLPQLVLTVLFKLEGQHDYWFGASWLALWLAAAVGLATLVQQRRALAGAAAAAGVLWAVLANPRDLAGRGYTLAEDFGKLHFAPLEQNAILILLSDDATALCRYLQIVENYRRDVLLIHETDLEEGTSGRPSFKFARLQQREPRLRTPDLQGMRAKFPTAQASFPGVLAFLNANADLLRERPIYLQRVPSTTSALRPDVALVPSGILQRLVPRGGEAATPFERSIPLEPAELLPRRRRERGQQILAGPDGLHVQPEAYEDRLFSALVKVRRGEAERLSRSAVPADLERAVAIYTSLRQVDPLSRSNRSLALSLIGCLVRLGRGAEELELLDALLRSDPPAELRAEGACLRGEILRGLGRRADAERSFQEALAVPGLDPAQHADLERRAKAR